MAPSSPISGTLLVSLPWSPQRASIFKINTTESIKGKPFSININGTVTTGVFGAGNLLWQSGSGALTIYAISDDNSVAVDKMGNPPNVDSLTLSIDGSVVQFT